MSRSRALVIALVFSGCAGVDADPDSVPLCGPVADLQPLLAEGACDERALAEYASPLSEQLLRPASQALVRVEFDEASR